MKRNASLYLIVGLVIIVSLVILVFGIFFLNDKDPRETYVTYYLRFQQVSTLTQDAPVKVNGVKLGRVEHIALHKNSVLVRATVKDDVKIPKDSDVRVQNIGLLGERQIGMVLGSDVQIYRPGDTINGSFDAGIAEVMGMAGEVLDSTKIIMNIAHKLLDSTFASKDFVNRFNRIIDKVENIEDQTMGMLQKTDPALQSSLASLSIAAKKVNEMLDENKEPLKKLAGDANSLVTNANGIMGEADLAVKKILILTKKLEAKDNTLGILLNDRKLHDDLFLTVRSADSLFRVILNDGLDVNVGFFK